MRMLTSMSLPVAGVAPASTIMLEGCAMPRCPILQRSAARQHVPSQHVGAIRWAVPPGLARKRDAVRRPGPRDHPPDAARDPDQKGTRHGSGLARRAGRILPTRFQA